MLRLSNYYRYRGGAVWIDKIQRMNIESKAPHKLWSNKLCCLKHIGTEWLHKACFRNLID